MGEWGHTFLLHSLSKINHCCVVYMIKIFFNIWGKGVDVWVRSQRSTASVDQLITMYTCMSKICIPGRNVLLLYIALHRMARASLYGHLCSKLLARVSTRQGHSCLISCIWLSNLTIPCHCFTIHKYRPVSVHKLISRYCRSQIE